MLKKMLLSVVGVAILSSGLVNANAQISNIQVGPGESALNIVESYFNTGESISRIWHFFPNNGGSALCDPQTLSPCSLDEQIDTLIVLPPCDTEILEWCIDGLSLYQKGNISIVDNAKLIRSTSGPIIKKKVEINLPQGGSTSLWEAEGLSNKGKTRTYAAYAVIKGSKASGTGKFVFHDFAAMVFPYSERSGDFYQEGSVANFIDNQGHPNVSISGGNPDCAWTENSKCGYIEDFADNTRAKLSIRIGNSLSGWLMGRMSDPIIEVKQLSTTQNLLIVDSEPVAIPKFQKKILTSQATPELIEADPQVKFGGMHNQLASMTMKSFLAWSKVVDDRANGLETVWSISTTTNGSGSQCLQDRTKLLGLVSTNAMVYEGTAPSYVDGSLQYKVAGLHNNSDGTEFLGKYDLLMRSDVARCIYGLPNLPISADISITSSDGTSKVATTVMNENNGWLRLGAYGFTFSSPTIKVKLGQGSSLPIKSEGTGQSSTPTPSASPSATLMPTPSASTSATVVVQKMTIICIKGKKVAKVSSTNPKCPAGYKKK
ncbi:MAG: hypothetical protein RL130_676 [Actinomycetota bacterium]|jgi:hypothetical protein